MNTPGPNSWSSTEAEQWDPPLPDADGFEHRVVETPGLRTHVATIGEGEPVVLLHGFPQHWWQWHAIAPLLAARYRVLCPDLRGAGWSSADDPRIRRDTRLRDLVAVLDQLGTGPIRVVSHDMGAITGAQLAYEHPERVLAMVQLSVPPMFMSFSPKLLPAFRHLPPLIWHRPGRSLRWLFTEDSAAKPLPARAIETHLLPMSRREIDQAVRALYRGMILPESLRLINGTYKRRRLQPPTLVAFGRRDAPFPESLVRKIVGDPQRHADRLELAFVDDAAHFITDDAPDAVAELALAWFEEQTERSQTLRRPPRITQPR
jgi:pimeloyl-ACP methyl ester carboxylesterase